MATPPKVLPIRPPKAPNLPISPVEYSQQYADQLLNALRLYFNQLDNWSEGLGQGTGGIYIGFPYGAFHYDDTTVLTSNITNVSTTPIPVASTVGFPDSGTIMIGTELISYTATTATAFDGTVTRGVYGTTKSAHSTGAAVSSAQGATAATATPVYFNATDFSNGIVLHSAITSRIDFTYSGIYNIQFSVQAGNSGASPDNMTLWLRQNGTDLPSTAGILTTPASHGGIDGAIIAAWNVFVTITTGDFIELYWTTDSGDSVLKTYPAGTSPTHPASPAVILTAQFVSAY